MPLDEYQRKRDFVKSPEPRGQTSQRGRTHDRYFCVHKHLASRLHYDLRLEHDGVLQSWAVPKGPSLDPTIKRLAMQTEDHPLEYGKFEGVIPEGYGAGIVMLWDYGTWQPQTDDVEAALRRGDLKFVLDGYKLKGSWALVRTRGSVRPGQPDTGRSWLLLKHRDAWSGPLDIGTFAPRSVKSGGDFEDILAEDVPARWLSNRPAKSGATGELLAQVIRRAAELKLAKTSGRAARARATTKARAKPDASARPPRTTTRGRSTRTRK